MKRDNSGNRNSHFPILHIIGLPGAGKTTLAKRLSRKLNLPVFQIGEYRSKGEAEGQVLRKGSGVKSLFLTLKAGGGGP